MTALPPLPRSFDNSMLSEYRICPRRFLYGYVFNWASDKPKFAADFGTTLHAGLAAFYSNLHDGFDAAQKAALAAVQQTYEELFNAEAEVIDSAEFAVIPPKYSLGSAITAITLYAMNHSSEPFTLPPIAVEQGFTLPLIPENDDLLYSGILDLVVHWPGLPGEVIIDHKTTGRFGYVNQQIVTMSSQLLGYTWSRMNYTDEPIHAVLNWLHIKQSGHEFHRTMPARYAERLISEWHAATVETVMEIRQRHASGFYPLHTNACFAFYGECPYITLCLHPRPPEEVWAAGRPASFVERIWSPVPGMRQEKSEGASNES